MIKDDISETHSVISQVVSTDRYLLITIHDNIPIRKCIYLSQIRLNLCLDKKAL